MFKLNKYINILINTLLNKINSFFFNISKIHSFETTRVFSFNNISLVNKKNIYYKYILSKFFNLKTKYELLEVEFIKINRKIIIENSTLTQLREILNNENNKNLIFNFNEILIHKKDKIYTDIFLFNTTTKDKLSIFDLIKIYYDKSKIFDNTLISIFKINQIDYNNYDKLYVEHLSSFKRRSYDIELNNTILEQHISELF